MTSTDPTVATVEEFCGDRVPDPDWVERNRAHGAELAERVPSLFVQATVTVPVVRAWVVSVVRGACAGYGVTPSVREGPSLRVLGATGTGKTHEAWGAVRALSVSGARCGWVFTTAADVYARLRPRPGVDSEHEFERYAKAALLVLDDLGAAKSTEWIEEVNYRLINYRYEQQKPTLFTSNLPMPELGAVLGERVKSRLVGMSSQVKLSGADRRRPQ